MINQTELKKLLRYNPETGEFWRKRKTRGCQFDSPMGNTSNLGYRRVWIGGRSGRSYQAHQLAWLYMAGEFPVLDIDHINGDRLDNRFENLREVSRSINLQNSLVCRSDSAVPYRGVSKNKHRFGARIVVEKVQHWLGTFDTPEEAHQAYLSAKEELHTGWVRNASNC